MIFDGFPRTVEQADALSKMVDIDMALLLDVPDEVIVNRMSGRRTCPNCQTTYHVVSAPPKVEGVCDKCGAKLGIRKDDKPEVVRERLAVYHSKTEPIVEYYRNKGMLKVVDGQASLEQTRALVAEAIGVEL